jgi:hypothetical protein
MYKFHKDRGLLNDDDQIVQIVKSHCSEKERIRLGKLLAEALNREPKDKLVQACIRQTKPPKSIETVSDGFGSVWAKKCPDCDIGTMVVVRPGKVQCDYCG